VLVAQQPCRQPLAAESSREAGQPGGHGRFRRPCPLLGPRRRTRARAPGSGSTPRRRWTCPWRRQPRASRASSGRPGPERATT
jgi:hypothetical protein